MRNGLNIKTANIFGITFLVAEREQLVHIIAADNLAVVQDFNGNDFDPKNIIGVELKKTGAFSHLSTINSTTGRKQYIRKEGEEGQAWQVISENVPQELRATVTDTRLASYGRSGIITEINADMTKVFLKTDSELSAGRAGRWYNMDRVSTRGELDVGHVAYVLLGDLRGQFVKTMTRINNMQWNCKTVGGVDVVISGNDMIRVTALQKARFAMFACASEEEFTDRYNAAAAADEIFTARQFWMVAVHIDEDTYQPTHNDGLYAPRRKYYNKDEATAAMNSMSERHGRTFYLMESVEYRQEGSAERVAFGSSNEEVQA